MKRALKGIAVAALVIVVGAAAYVASTPRTEAMFTPGVCTYYADAKFRKVVGARGSDCCGEPISWGIVTAYRKCEPLYCLDVLCPDPIE